MQQRRVCGVERFVTMRMRGGRIPARGCWQTTGYLRILSAARISTPSPHQAVRLAAAEPASVTS